MFLASHRMASHGCASIEGHHRYHQECRRRCRQRHAWAQGIHTSHTCTHTHTSTHTCTHTSIHTHMHTHKHVHTHMHTQRTQNDGGTNPTVCSTGSHRVLIVNLRPLSCTCTMSDHAHLISWGKATAIALADTWRQEHSQVPESAEAFWTVKFFVTLVFWQGVVCGGNVSVCNHG